jgi:glutathione S-transferase
MYVSQPPPFAISSTFETVARALIRLQAHHIDRTLVPSFYRYLQAQDPDKRTAGGREFHQAIETLVGLFERAENQLGSDQKYLGLWSGGDLGLADVLVGPCACFFHLAV